MMENDDALTDKQMKFIEEYLLTSNASEAAKRAGYEGDGYMAGYRNLRNPKINELISFRLAKNQISQNAIDESVFSSLYEVAFSETRSRSARLTAMKALVKIISKFARLQDTRNPASKISVLYEWMPHSRPFPDPGTIIVKKCCCELPVDLHHLMYKHRGSR